MPCTRCLLILLDKLPLLFFITPVYMIRIMESGEVCTFTTSEEEYGRYIEASHFECFYIFISIPTQRSVTRSVKFPHQVLRCIKEMF
jgi:hypothetical protein